MAYLRAYQAMAGDPGFFKKLGKGFKKFGKNVGRLAPLAAGMLPFPGAGIVAQTLGGMQSSPGCGPMQGDPGLGSFLGGIGRRVFSSNVGRTVAGVGARILPVLAGGTPAGIIARTVLGGAAAGVASGALGRMFGGGGGGGGARSYRRMNPTNPKALRRAMRRVEGFAKLAKSTMSFTQQHRLRKRGRKR